jgi:hypothetical protein
MLFDDSQTKAEVLVLPTSSKILFAQASKTTWL